MRELIEILSDMVYVFHEVFIILFQLMGLELTDKEMHFWVIGAIGIGIFLIVHIVFKRLARWSITSISWIYTFSVILVLVFAIEIQQGITRQGTMDFQDAVYGIWGFLAFFALFLTGKGIVRMIRRLFKK